MIELVSESVRIDRHLALREVGGIGHKALPIRFDRLLPGSVLDRGTDGCGVTFFQWFGYVAGHEVRLLWDSAFVGAVSVLADDTSVVELVRTALWERAAA